MSVYKVSVIIRCYNEERHIGRLLSGIREQTLNNVEIVVVDSGSTDATVPIASRYPIELVQINPEEFSFGYSLNKGCERASGEILVFASAHVYPVYVDWLENLVAPLTDEGVALSYGKQRGNDVTRYSEHQIFAKWFPEESRMQDSNPFCNNANSALRRDTWEEYRFDEDLTGLEDLAWAHSQQGIGKKIAYVPAAEVVHVHEESALKIFNRYKREAIALKTIMPSEHFSLWDMLRLVSSNIAIDYYHAFKDQVLYKNIIDIPLFRLMQFSGTYSGFRQHGPVSGPMKHEFYYPRGIHRSDTEPASTHNRIDYARVHMDDE